MITFARQQPLRSIVAIAAALVMMALGFYVASANADSGGKTSADDRGGLTTTSDDPAGDPGAARRSVSPACSGEPAEKPHIAGGPIPVRRRGSFTSETLPRCPVRV